MTTPYQQGYPQQPYAQPQVPGYGYSQQPQYGQPQGFPNGGPPPVPQAEPLPKGSLDDFYNQPTGGGGKSLATIFMGPNNVAKPVGTKVRVQVTRDVTSNDIQAQTDPVTKQVQRFKDGRVKYVMIVPVQVLWSSDGSHQQLFPDGSAGWYVKGVLTDELNRAMAAVGVKGAPKGGAIIDITSAGEKPAYRAGFSATKLYNLEYTLPANAPVAAPAPVQQAPVPQAGFVPPTTPADTPTPSYAAPPTMPAAPAAAPINPVQMPPGLSPENQALFQSLLTGQAAPQQ